jgi:hypothetical protein
MKETGGIKQPSEFEVPTEEHNSTRTADLAARHPNTSPGLMEHLQALGMFLETSSLARYSDGIKLS